MKSQLITIFFPVLAITSLKTLDPLAATDPLKKPGPCEATWRYLVVHRKQSVGYKPGDFNGIPTVSAENHRKTIEKWWFNGDLTVFNGIL